MNSLNRITPITNALGWTRMTPGSAYWIMPNGQTFNEVERAPITSDNEPNLKKSEFLIDLMEYQNGQYLKQSGKVTDIPGTQGMRPDIFENFRKLDKVMNTYGHRGLDYVKDRIIQQSGPIAYDDFANVKKVRDAIFFFGKDYRQHILTDMVSTFTTNYLDFRALRFTPPDNQIWDDMGFYALPEMTKGSYESITGALKSQAYLFSITEDFYYNDYQVNPIADHRRALQGEIDLALNKKVADSVLAIASSDTTDWTTPDASNLRTDVDPSKYLQDQVSTLIKKQRWNPNRILSSWNTVSKYLKNFWIAGDMSDIASISRPSLLVGRLNNPKFLPGVEWGWDDMIDALPDEYLLLYALEAFKLGLGPRRVANVTDPISGNITNLVRYWCLFKIFDFDAPEEVYIKVKIT